MKIDLALFSSFTKLFNLKRYSSLLRPVDVSKLLWNKKPMQEHSILVWDLENISFKNLEVIKSKAAYSPEKLYVVTKQRISAKKRVKIEEEGFKILDLHKNISDQKIIDVMKLYSLYPNMILISSDSDFVNSVKVYVQKNKLQWIMKDSNKKRILMKMDISNKNLKISTI